MLRQSHAPWWKRMFVEARVPAYIPVRSADARHCPECSAGYEPTDRYCPACKFAVPEWQFG